MSFQGKVDEFYRSNRQALFTCALSITRSVEAAEDAIQEAFYRIYRYDSWKVRNLKTFVFQCVRNAAIDQLRKRPATESLDDVSLFDLNHHPRQVAMGREREEALAAALESLDPDERQTIVEHLCGGLKFREIADIRGIPQGTVSAWYYRGLAKMKARLEEQP
ncbi:MAG: sigma-70 family RNA polymerase sigma factor [Candidatus Omnitrophica bacterium]|nr:sigma-70 family RNA polymerase sigma factor [Candidatus Omnitrophota bacterium]